MFEDSTINCIMYNKTLSPTADVTISDMSGISDETIAIYTWVFSACLCQTIDIFGVVTNIINVVCFIKQGFKEPVNISLCGLAVSDIGCLVTQIFVNIFYTLDVSSDDLAFDPLDVFYLTIAMPHLAFNRINIWITVIITMERCLCITIPMKIKSIVTPRRVWILISCVYIFLTFSGAPVYAVNGLGSKLSAVKNRTLLGLVSTADKDKVEGITFAINNFILPFIGFIIIIICTTILSVNLRKRTQWLKTSTTSSKAFISNRDQKVAKMVVMISVLFIICFTPLAILMFAVMFEPNLNVGGRFVKISEMLGHIVLLMESVNSSVNIFIYYHMSRKYRDTFREFLCMDIHKPL